jgi:hypothetical protein
VGREQTENEKGTEVSATTRRAILLGGAVGLAGLVADSVLSAEPASATQGNPVNLERTIRVRVPGRACSTRRTPCWRSWQTE